jgi:glucosamine--fructose-6-phosphate aminotransferase (isomerizing)
LALTGGAAERAIRSGRLKGAVTDLSVEEVVHPPFGRTRHPYFMHDMLRRQPVATQATLALSSDALDAVPMPPAEGYWLFVGTGTSYHAAEATARGGEESGLPVGRCVPQTAFEVAGNPDRYAHAAVAVIFSASGETLVTNAALERLAERKVPTVLVTAAEKGRAASLADHVLLTRYADETSWTHTVSYTSALALAQALVTRFRGVDTVPPIDPDALQEAVVEALALENTVVEFIDQLTTRPELLLIGSGSAETTAREGALKLREASGRFASVNATEEFLHGTLPSIGPRVAVVALSRTERERDRSVSGLRAAASLGALTVLIDSSGSAPAPEPIVTWAVRPAGDASLPIVQVVPLQLMAYWLAVSEGRNPDVMGLDDPRYLASRQSFRI